MSSGKNTDDTQLTPEELKKEMEGSPPNITAVCSIFVGITIVYLALKMEIGYPGDGVLIGLGYLGFVLISQYFFNMWTMLQIHQDSDGYTGLQSLLFWVVFILLYFIINYGFTSWKIPFSNTFGYFIADIIINSDKEFKNILQDPSTLPLISEGKSQVHAADNINRTTKNKEIRDAIRFMTADPSIVLTKTTYERFNSFWSNLGNAGLLKSNWNTMMESDDQESAFNKLKRWLYVKDLVSEGIWLTLCGVLTILVSYSYITSSDISPSEEALKRKSDIRAKGMTMNQQSNNAFMPENFLANS